MKNRPFGLAIIAILVGIEAVIQILASLALFGVSTVGLFATPYTGPMAAVLALSSLALIIGIIELAVASGLWTMEKWAWVIATIVLWIDVVFDVIAGIIKTQSWTAVLVSLIIPVIVLIYLYMPGVRKVFDK